MSQATLTLEQARRFYQDADSAHDFEHILRVTRMAEYLAQEEGADVGVVRAAALLHDIARHNEDTAADSGIDHAQTSAQDARAFLMQHGADDSFAARVAEAIRSHRFRGTTKPSSLEAKILFDADKLDAIGAIGVARAYAVGGKLNQKLFSEADQDALATRDQLNSEHTPVAEFHVKLKHLHERFYTPTAKRIARERHAFMKQFFDRLAHEVHGEM